MITLEGLSFKVVKRPLHQKNTWGKLLGVVMKILKTLGWWNYTWIQTWFRNIPNKKFRPLQGLTGH